MFTLPVGYRPLGGLITVGGGNCKAANTDIDGKCRVDIYPSGDVWLVDTLPTVLTITGITFRVP